MSPARFGWMLIEPPGLSNGAAPANVVAGPRMTSNCSTACGDIVFQGSTPYRPFSAKADAAMLNPRIEK
jgi:hypothetical protein